MHLQHTQLCAAQRTGYATQSRPSVCPRGCLWKAWQRVLASSAPMPSARASEQRERGHNHFWNPGPLSFLSEPSNTHPHAAIVAGTRHVPVGRTVLAECVPPRRDALRDSADGTRLEGRDPRKHGWQPWRGARLRQDQDGSTGKFLADTRAPSSLWRARCGRTPPKSYATAFGLESAHAPLLAKTHPINCTSP